MVFSFQWCTQMYVRLKRGLATFEFYFPKRTVSQLTYNLWRRTKCVSDFAWSHYILTAVFLPHRADILRCVFSIAYLRMQKGNKKVYYNTQYAVQTHKKLLQILIFWKTCFSCWIHECTLWINYLGNGQWLQFWYILKTGPTASLVNVLFRIQI